MIIWASHQRCSLELPLGCETFMAECPSLRIVCELYLFMICVFCLPGTSFEKVSCTYGSQQFPFVLASLQTAEGVTNGASSAGGLREPLSARCLWTHCPSSQLLPAIFDRSLRKNKQLCWPALSCRSVHKINESQWLICGPRWALVFGFVPLVCIEETCLEVMSGGRLDKASQSSAVIWHLLYFGYF